MDRQREKEKDRWVGGLKREKKKVRRGGKVRIERRDIVMKEKRKLAILSISIPSLTFIEVSV